MNEKAVGYALLTVGLLIITIAGINVYQVFTSNAQPISLFNFPAISVDIAIDPNLPKMTQEILPAQAVNQSANVAAHLFLMGFVVSIGYRVASLGTQLVRTINVVVKEKTPLSSVLK